MICVEPDESNIARLQHNLAANNLNSYVIVEGGLWSCKGWLDMDYSFRDGQEWSRALKPSTNSCGNVPVFSVEDIKKQNGWDSIDLLKMDIEGAEDTIFSQKEHLSFLNSAKVVTIEIHDMYNVGHRVAEALLSYGFRIYFSGELMIGIKKAAYGEK